MARTRTTKRLAKRIELHYFQRPHPFRRLKSAMIIAAVVVSAGWVAFSAFSKNSAIYSKGPMSTAHAMLANRCDVCHTAVPAATPEEAEARAAAKASNLFARPVSGAACLKCHGGPIHHENQIVASGVSVDCASCHVEHRGQVDLRLQSDRSCTQCHANLQTRNGSSSFVRQIRAFHPQDHPEFAVFRSHQEDGARIKLNHQVHLRQELKLYDGRVVQMVCSDCHRPANYAGPWPYGQEAPAEKYRSPGSPSRPRSLDAAYMAPIEYSKQCSGCHDHDLEFDKAGRFPNLHAPHDKPEVVRGFLVWTYRDALKGPVRKPEPGMELSDYRYPGRPAAAPEPLSGDPWVVARIRDAEMLLFKKGCKVCHTMEFSADQLPRVAPTAIPVRWLEHSAFDHKPHRDLTCIACHDQTSKSVETADVLLPKIGACFNCHQQSPAATLGRRKAEARAGCAECHLYHDKTKENGFRGMRSIQELSSGTIPAGKVAMAKN